MRKGQAWVEGGCLPAWLLLKRTASVMRVM